MNTYNKKRKELVIKTLCMLADENNWQVKQVITVGGLHRIIYKIPAG